MKRIIVSAMTAVAVFGFSAGIAGCGTAIQGGQSNTIQSASTELGDSSVNINVAGYRLGRGSWEVNSSTEAGTSSGSLGAQKVLVCDLLLTNNSNVKTVISPIDLLSAAQGARYDAKVLTNGHDCGNGRFCADLDEAHEFCQRFADSVVGLGESLDDMCEDRREVASLAQDVDADNRGQEYNNHDNSEIGE